MKKILFIIIALIALISCSDKKFENPFDPEVSIATPENLQLEITGSTEVTLSWTDIYFKETGFSIDRKIGTGNWENIYESETGNIHQWKDTTAPQYQDLQYRVAVVYDKKLSEYAVSNVIKYFPAPVDLVLNQVDISSFKLSWMDECVGEDGFVIERSINGENFALVKTTEPDVQEYIDVLTTKGIYNITYRVKAITGEDQSAYSYVSRILNFPPPTDANILQIGLGAVRVSWQINSVGHQGFYIDKKVGDTWIEKFVTVAPDISYYDDEDVALNTEIQYRIYAFNGDFYSEPLETELHQNNLSEPLNVHYIIQSSTELILNWDYMYSDLDGFVIERNQAESGWEVLSEVDGSTRNVTDINFDIFEPISYRIKALYHDYESEFVTIEFLINDDMIFVDGGNYQMGDVFGLGNADELPVHNVAISDFWISNHEVTFDEYDEYCNDTNQPLVSDSGWGRGEHPIINVTWLDAIRYCNWLSRKHGFTEVYTIDGDNVTMNSNATGYAIPTEAEWEYAASGGLSATNTVFSGSDIASEVAIYDTNSPSLVMQKNANELGIYDMSGNVWEWCWDFYEDDYYTFCNAQGTVIDPVGPNSSSYRVFRGGSWSHDENSLRISNRSGLTQDYSSTAVGFRIIRRKR